MKLMLTRVEFPALTTMKLFILRSVNVGLTGGNTGRLSSQGHCCLSVLYSNGTASCTSIILILEGYLPGGGIAIM